MGDPKRLLEDGDAFERRVLWSATDDVPSSRVRERVMAIGVGLAVATSGVAAASSAAAAVKGVNVVGGAGALKWTVAVAVVGVATAGVAKYTAPKHAPPPPALVTAQAVSTPQPFAPVRPKRQPALPVAPVVSAMVEPPIAPAPAVHKPAAPSDLLEELALLDAARAALDAGDTSLAIEKLDRHDLDYMHGQLAPDSLALRVEVYAKRQDDAKVEELGKVFLARYPEHPQASRVSGLLARAGGGERR